MVKSMVSGFDFAFQSVVIQFTTQVIKRSDENCFPLPQEVAAKLHNKESLQGMENLGTTLEERNISFSPVICPMMSHVFLRISKQFALYRLVFW